ncbi:S8 family serine peptidase [Rhizomonospora bruguierae]|uniref:S8 family serine peptidase n=1 Tax=Rhizomonospora bruguierae TaxID=1581705 RepID=UPI001BCC5F91|nr:S8 family serine peptidase [Micromonospora sp. NBRC 107566]
MSRPAVEATPRGGAGAVVATVFVALWVVGVTVVTQVAGWFVEQARLVSGLPHPSTQWLFVAAIPAVLAGAPAALLASVPRSSAVRAAGRAWLCAAVAGGLLGAWRAVPAVQHEWYLAGLAATAAVMASLLARRGRAHAHHPSARTPNAQSDSSPSANAPADSEPSAGTRPGSARSASAPADAGRPASAAGWFAVAAGLVVLLPWLWIGALGGLAETLLAALAAASVGWLAARVLDERLWAPYRRGRARLILLGGLVAGVALVPLAAGTGGPGAHLAALLVLPPLGFAAAALHPLATHQDTARQHTASQGAASQGAGSGGTATGGAPTDDAATGYLPAGSDAAMEATRPPWPSAPVGWLVGVVAFGPLAFVDPEEVTLLLAGGADTPVWVGGAALASLLLAVLVALVYGLALARRRFRTGIAAAVTVVVALAGGTVYATAGQPGLHGERLFVVMREQADLSDITAGGRTGQAGRDARAREVYQRLTEHARRTQAGLRAELDRLRLPYTPYYLVNGVEVHAGGPVLRTLLGRRSDVDRVLLDQRPRPLPEPPAPMRGHDPPPTSPMWNLTLLRAPQAWAAGATGAGIVVGSSDSGVDGAHPALAAGFRGGQDSWYDPWNGTRSPVDVNGHGTHTLASAVGHANVGVAPGARWTGCVNLARNLGNPARYLDCLQFMLAPFPPGADPFTAGRPERAPHVLTNSWGCATVEGCDAQALLPAVHAIAAAGIFFVVAAGNTGPYCGSIAEPPAGYPDAFTVGAVDRSGTVAAFSSRGPVPGASKPDVVAPGSQVLSALPGGGYGTLSGTSMAAPHVAGLVALLWSKNPELIGDLFRTRRLIQDSTRPARPSYRSRNPADACGTPANITGAGIPDADASTRAAMSVG